MLPELRRWLLQWASPVINRSLDEWREIRGQALDIKHSDVMRALRDELQARMNAALATLTDPGTTELAMRIAQGRYLAHKCDIMVLDDLIRMASSAAKKALKTEENS